MSSDGMCGIEDCFKKQGQNTKFEAIQKSSDPFFIIIEPHDFDSIGRNDKYNIKLIVNVISPHVLHLKPLDWFYGSLTADQVQKKNSINIKI